MSGSYDRPTGRRDQATSQTATNFDLYDTVLTGPTGRGSQHHTYDLPPIGEDDTPRLAQDGRARRSRKPKNEPVEHPGRAARHGHRPLADARHLHHVLPRLSDGGRRLHDQRVRQCLAQGHRQRGHGRRSSRARAWMSTRRCATPRHSCASHAGISRANALSLDESSKLLEPWLGQSDVLAALPVPRLIAIEIDRNSPPEHRGTARRAHEAVPCAPRSTTTDAGSSRSAP